MLAKKSDDMAALQSALRTAQDGVDAAKAAAAASAKKCADLEALLRGKDAGTAAVVWVCGCGCGCGSVGVGVWVWVCGCVGVRDAGGADQSQPNTWRLF